jgi:acetyltransferase-like isoleucine patch superfamily enzyme
MNGQMQRPHVQTRHTRITECARSIPADGATTERLAALHDAVHIPPRASASERHPVHSEGDAGQHHVPGLRRRLDLAHKADLVTFSQGWRRVVIGSSTVVGSAATVKPVVAIYENAIEGRQL